MPSVAHPLHSLPRDRRTQDCATLLNGADRGVPADGGAASKALPSTPTTPLAHVSDCDDASDASSQQAGTSADALRRSSGGRAQTAAESAVHVTPDELSSTAPSKELAETLTKVHEVLVGTAPGELATLEQAAQALRRLRGDIGLPESAAESQLDLLAAAREAADTVGV